MLTIIQPFWSHLLLLDSNPVLIHGQLAGNYFEITLSEVIYVIIAAIIGLLAETLVGWRLPFGIIGATLASLVGIWLLTVVIPISIAGDITIGGEPIPIIKAALGALLVVSLWHFITYPVWRGRERYNRRSPRRRRSSRYRRNYDY